jgi:hypothetical protein
MAGRIQGQSTADLIDGYQWVAALTDELGSAFVDMFKFNVEFFPVDEWLQVDVTPPSLSGGRLPSISEGGRPCENEHPGGFEICFDGGVTGIFFDFNVHYGALPILDPGSLSLARSKGPVKNITFGITDPNALHTVATDVATTFGTVFNLVNGIVQDPLAFAVKQAVVAIDGAGVTYESGSGDYAEWLERLTPDEKIVAADIVGVVGGKISRNTDGADHVMAVSFKPIVLGNMPPEGQQHLYEKVAFMGQTLVKVRGRVQVGDFIVPSGRNDGTGIAVRPDSITAEQLGTVVGVAWEANSRSFGLVNVAVGLQAGDIAKVVGRHETELVRLRKTQDHMQARLTSLADAGAALKLELARVLQTLTDLVPGGKGLRAAAIK